MAPPALLDELVEEVLLRFPPHDPARLVRAALVCKRWRRLVSEPRFRRRFREFHRTPPLLGLLCNLSGDDNVDVARFVPTSPFCSPRGDRRYWRALDARHGRVLFRSTPSGSGTLVVWDPITDNQRTLPAVPRYSRYWSAAVLCSGAGACDHLDCHGGAFLVVFLGFDKDKMFTCIHSSDAGAWSEPIYTQHHSYGDINPKPGALVGNALYFKFPLTNTGLKYDLELHEISVIQLPQRCSVLVPCVLATMEDGGLGVAAVDGSKLYVWSREACPEADAGWIQRRVVKLETLLPIEDLFTFPNLVGFAGAVGIIFLAMGDVLFKFDLRTYLMTKVCEGRRIRNVVPYLSFYTPAPVAHVHETLEVLM